MANTVEDDNLEKARARLEAALSKLASGVASSKKALKSAREMAAEKADLTVRIAELEQDNLALQEEVATLNLQSPKAANDGAFETLKQEKAAIEQNYMLLKKQYMSLQDQLDAANADSGNEQKTTHGADTRAIEALEADNEALQQEVQALRAEKDGIKERLDASIAKLEELLGS
ncbi:hypothetical protein GCM10017044_13560 [Kordiimonas sediminis]|uniref:Uncharacterized protein n=1 Tax=Kordiimonas sediminis TaxID=1735581 RepID=A0A919ARL6_9PROT|nr:hypothetical protein [Kordiimonas sediminis]GHF20063.1 hypothetical protein GCM10017044_13560 [Kordiimonas sediminis]